MRAKDIRKIGFEMVEGTTEAIARKVIEVGLMEEDEKEHLLLQATEAQVRRALKGTNPATGLPYFAPVEESDEDGEDGEDGDRPSKGPIWKQPLMMNLSEMTGISKRNYQRILEDAEKVRIWNRSIRNRFGEVIHLEPIDFSIEEEW